MKIHQMKTYTVMKEPDDIYKTNEDEIILRFNKLGESVMIVHEICTDIFYVETMKEMEVGE